MAGDPPPFDPGAGGAFHAGRVALGATRLATMPEGTRLLPGMTLSAEVKVGSRRVIAYLLDPLTRGLRESIREP